MENEVSDGCAGEEDSPILQDGDVGSEETPHTAEEPSLNSELVSASCDDSVLFITSPGGVSDSSDVVPLVDELPSTSSIEHNSLLCEPGVSEPVRRLSLNTEDEKPSDSSRTLTRTQSLDFEIESINSSESVSKKEDLIDHFRTLVGVLPPQLTVKTPNKTNIISKSSILAATLEYVKELELAENQIKWARELLLQKNHQLHVKISSMKAIKDKNIPKWCFEEYESDVSLDYDSETFVDTLNETFFVRSDLEGEYRVNVYSDNKLPEQIEDLSDAESLSSESTATDSSDTASDPEIMELKLPNAPRIPTPIYDSETTGDTLDSEVVENEELTSLSSHSQSEDDITNDSNGGTNEVTQSDAGSSQRTSLKRNAGGVEGSTPATEFESQLSIQVPEATTTRRRTRRSGPALQTPEKSAIPEINETPSAHVNENSSQDTSKGNKTVGDLNDVTTTVTDDTTMVADETTTVADETTTVADETIAGVDETNTMADDESSDAENSHEDKSTANSIYQGPLRYKRKLAGLRSGRVLTPAMKTGKRQLFLTPSSSQQGRTRQPESTSLLAANTPETAFPEVVPCANNENGDKSSEINMTGNHPGPVKRKKDFARKSVTQKNSKYSRPSRS